MNGSVNDFELPTSFGARSASTRISSQNNLNQMHTMMVKKNEHNKKMESHNSLSFQLRELGAELMLNYEEFGRETLDVLTGNYFLRKFNMICEYLKSLEEEEVSIPEQQNVVTVTKVDVIQKQLEELKLKMEKIHNEVKKKNEEIEYYRKELNNEHSTQAEIPRRTSLMPAELDDDRQLQEVKANKKRVMEEMLANQKRKTNNIEEND